MQSCTKAIQMVFIDSKYFIKWEIVVFRMLILHFIIICCVSLEWVKCPFLSMYQYIYVVDLNIIHHYRIRRNQKCTSFAMPLRPHKEKTLWNGKTLMLNHCFWTFTLNDTLLVLRKLMHKSINLLCLFISARNIYNPLQI